MSLQSTDIQRKPSLLQRNSSQLLQHASKFSLKRSLTTKVSSSPTLQPRPRPSISFSANTHSSHGRNSTRALQEQQQRQQAQLQLKEYIPPPPLEVDTANQIKPTSGKGVNTTIIIWEANNVTTDLLHHHHDRALSSIPENKRQSNFRTQTTNPPAKPTYYRAFLSSIAHEFKRRIISSDRIKNDIEYHNVFDGKEAVVREKSYDGEPAMHH